MTNAGYPITFYAIDEQTSDYRDLSADTWFTNGWK